MIITLEINATGKTKISQNGIFSSVLDFSFEGLL
jgi:hypothetical protein